MSEEKPYPKLATLCAEYDAMDTRHRAEEHEQQRRHRAERIELGNRVVTVQYACGHERIQDLGYDYPQGERSRCLDCGAERSTVYGWQTRPGAVSTK